MLLSAASSNSLASVEQSRKASRAQAEVSAASKQPSNGTISKKAAAGKKTSKSSSKPWSWLSILDDRACKANQKTSQSTSSQSSALPAHPGNQSADLPDASQAKESSGSGSGKNPFVSTLSKKQASSKNVKADANATSNPSKPEDRESTPLGRGKIQNAAEQQQARSPSKATAELSAVPGSARQSPDRPGQAQQSSLTGHQPESAAMNQSSATVRQPNGAVASKEKKKAKRLAGGMSGHTSGHTQPRSKSTFHLPSTSEAREANPAASPPKRQSASRSNPARNSPDHFANWKRRLLTDSLSPASNKATSGSMHPQDLGPASRPRPATAGAVSPSSGHASPSLPNLLQSRGSTLTYVGLSNPEPPPPALGIWKTNHPPAAGPSSATKATADTPLATAGVSPAFSLGGGVCMPPGNWGQKGRLVPLKEPPQSSGKVGCAHDCEF